MSDNLDSRIWNARGNFPAFSKSDKIDSTEEVGTLLSENYKQAKDAVKDKSFNIANLMSTSLKVAIENKSNKKQKLIAAREKLEQQINISSTKSKEDESRANFVAGVILGL